MDGSRSQGFTSSVKVDPSSQEGSVTDHGWGTRGFLRNVPVENGRRISKSDKTRSQKDPTRQRTPLLRSMALTIYFVTRSHILYQMFNPFPYSPGVEFLRSSDSVLLHFWSRVLTSPCSTVCYDSKISSSCPTQTEPSLVLLQRTSDRRKMGPYRPPP